MHSSSNNFDRVTYNYVDIVVIVNTEGLPAVRKPNIRMEFNVYMTSQANENAKSRMENRQLLFWYSRKVSLEDQKTQSIQFFKLLIEPETFPRGTGYWLQFL